MMVVLWEGQASRWRLHLAGVAVVGVGVDSASDLGSGSHQRELLSSHGSPGALSTHLSIKILEENIAAHSILLHKSSV
jgi:hypothetical protein